MKLKVEDECWLVSCAGSVEYLGKKLFTDKTEAIHYYKRVMRYSGVTKDEVLIYRCYLYNTDTLSEN